MKDGNYNAEKHVNYCHLVGAVGEINHITNPGVSPHTLILLDVETEYRGKKHPKMTIQVVVWGKVKQFQDGNIQVRDILHIEGRVTVRTKRGKDYFGITGNRVQVVRTLNDAEPYAEEIGVVSTGE